MARRLFIVRHSEAQANDPRGDEKRELTEDGREVATELGRALRAEGAKPSMILCSHATRAVQTLDALLGEMDLKGPQTVVSDDFYRCGTTGWIKAVAGLDQDMDQAMLVGHQPVLSALVQELSGKMVSMRPCAACLLDVQGNWNDLPGCDVAAKMVFPGMPR